MAFKALLFVAVAVAAFAYTSATECYLCNSQIVPGCAKEQGKRSNSFDCASQTPLTGLKYNCLKTVYEIGGYEHVQRNCIEKNVTCGTLRKQFKAQGVDLKECLVCGKKLCNGQ
ncbi:unnamed protein product [Acanthoscelides obtectus]|uniref:Protein sleepless n=1 Tax=Acanthoscelides obtectus TaxID=200917 RepID=A0A9P0LT91_ACAOB|nr:unnamed protein product [Acanthoscelides obtectus]CAK1677939.1 hypothetical protein AOBTE_LOCUS31660 [Acanthoscelides obtectus]